MDVKDIKLKANYTTDELSGFRPFLTPFIADEPEYGCVGCFVVNWVDFVSESSIPRKVPTYAEYIFFCGLRRQNPVSFKDFRSVLPECIRQEQEDEGCETDTSSLETTEA